jgi:predicted transcriptional regulator
MADRTAENGLPVTHRELEALKAAWDRGREATVYDLLEDLPEGTPYTSALSIYQTLEDKGLVTHRREGRKYVYVPAIAESTVRMKALNYVLEVFYDGDADALADDVATHQRAPGAS